MKPKSNCMRRNWRKLILLLLSSYALTSAWGQAGELEQSFGNHGIIKTDLNGNFENESAFRVVPQSNGKLLVMFTARGINWITRYASNGSREQSITQFENGYANLSTYYGLQ